MRNQGGMSTLVKLRTLVRKLVAGYKSRKLHKDIIAGRAPRGRT
jgi:hypothetical protein